MSQAIGSLASGPNSHHSPVMAWDEDLDTTGMKCPLPVLKARKRLNGMQPGAVLRLTTTDPMAVIDVPHFCAEAGHELISREVVADGHVWLLRRTAVAAAEND